VSALTPLEKLVLVVVRAFLDQHEAFTSLDVSNACKILSPEIHHRDVAVVVKALWHNVDAKRAADLFAGYRRARVEVFPAYEEGTLAWVYYPEGADLDVAYPDARRHLTAVPPAPSPS